ncbi:hypothetical protein G6W61_30220 [Streptomyces sp. KAI-26]|nr:MULTISPECIES: hypothetical protein [Streptomyces]MBH0245214.1 hypothetical protein [Streptomyces cavourensis]NUV90442.1 hypothetical protein [Streptomyces sp. KAI-26]NUW24333.1 hypothetical protein [Streptomyces roseoviolaceus]
MPVVTPNITRGRRLLLTLFVVAAALVLAGLLARGLVLLGGLLPDRPGA